MSQKKHLDLLCFIFPKSKRCSVHLFVKKKNIDKFDKIPGGASHLFGQFRYNPPPSNVQLLSDLRLLGVLLHVSLLWTEHVARHKLKCMFKIAGILGRPEAASGSRMKPWLGLGDDLLDSDDSNSEGNSFCINVPSPSDFFVCKFFYSHKNFVFRSSRYF